MLDATLRGRNMRVHVVSALLVALVGGGLRTSVGEELALLLCVFLVLAAEVLNTGLEALVDLYSREIDARARVAKDAAAGAVLVLAAGSVLVLTAVVVRAWPDVAADPARVLRHAALGVPLTAAAALLVARWGRPAAVDAVLAVAGAGLLAVALPRFTSVAFGALAVGAFGWCAAAALAGRRSS